jgi:hypothetical protein
MRIIFKSLLLSTVVLLSSCATIISGSRQNVEIISEPSSAKIYLNEIEIGTTPIEKNLKRNQEYSLILKLDGYETYETKLEKKFNAWYIGNLAFGGLIGIIIDPITGAIHKLKPEEIDGNPKSGTTYHTKDGKLVVKISMTIDPNSEKIGQLEKSK